MVLSFMIVWDLPTISRGVQSLKTSRLSAMYAEVAPSVTVFAKLFGRALQAQARVCQHPVTSHTPSAQGTPPQREMCELATTPKGFMTDPERWHESSGSTLKGDTIPASAREMTLVAGVCM